jgi:hypothetical protein
VQSSRTLLKARDGSLAAQAMLGGLLRCAGCGHTLKISSHLERKTGRRYPGYYCSGRFASGPCTARASVRASTVDRYVEELVVDALRWEGSPLAQAVKDSGQIEEAARAAADAEHELDVFVGNPKLISILGEQKFVEGVEVRQRALDQARQELTEARAQSMIVEELTSGDLLEAWPDLTIQEKRKLLHGLLDKVVVKKAGARGRLAPPVKDRVQIVLRGGVVLEPTEDEAETG